MRFRDVCREVVELPDVLIEIASGVHMVESDSLPVIVPESTGSHHLEILNYLMSRLVRMIEGIGQAGPFYGHLGVAVIDLRSPDAQDLQDRRNHINGVAELVSDAAMILKTTRPVYDHWIVYTAFVGGPLVEPVRRIIGHCPAQWISRIRHGPAQLIQFLQHGAYIGCGARIVP